MQSISAFVLFCCALVLCTSLGWRAEAFSQNVRSADRSVCDEAALRAAQEFGVPPKILKAIGRTESGVTLQGAFVPWPWTINVEGQGQRFETRKEALDYFHQRFAGGSRNIDLGCFQINHRWHGDEFVSAGAMLDPLGNARYAAGFLKELHDEFGNWTTAVGAFHSRNREFSSKYLARFEPILRDLGTKTGSTRASAGSVRPNAFPLLKGTSDSNMLGSLFPKETSGRGSLLTPRDGRG